MLVVIGISIPNMNKGIYITKVIVDKNILINGLTDILVTIIELLRFLDLAKLLKESSYKVLNR